MANCLFCLSELSLFEVNYHARCAKQVFGGYPPPTLPFSSDQLDALGKRPVLFTKKPRQTKLSLADTGKLQVYTFDDSPLFLPEATHLLGRMAVLAKIDMLHFALLPDNEGEYTLVTNQLVVGQSLAELENVPTNYQQLGTLYKLFIALQKHSQLPAYDTIQLAERALFLFFAAGNGVHWGNIYIYNSRLAPMGIGFTDAVLNPQYETESPLSINYKNKNINWVDWQKLFTALSINTKAQANLWAKYNKLFRPSVELIEESFLPQNLKRRYAAVMLARAEALGIM